MPPTYGHAVVAHSAYGYKGDGTFSAGLETRAVTRTQATKVAHAGGVVFPSYGMAEEYAMDEQYPPDNFALVPSAPGTFAQTKIDGLAVYVPNTRPAGALA